MSTLHEYGFIEQDHKQDILQSFRGAELEQEIMDAQEAGYDISYGETYDEAYNNPDAVRRVFSELGRGQQLFAREMGRFDIGYQSLLTNVRLGAPSANVRNWAKNRLSNREVRAEELRLSLLYNRLNVQGGPWHDQGGKALALGTIVDAHDLVNKEGIGAFERISGRLDPAIMDMTFGSNAGWLHGLGLEDAIISAEQRFKGHTRNVVEQSATEEMRKLGEFTSAPVAQGFRDIVAYCTDSLGIRSRKEEVRLAINKHIDQSDKDSFLMMSVGCGTALPMLEVMQDLKTKKRDSKLILLDQDPIALAAAQQFAEQMGLADNIEIHCEQLFHGKGRKTRLLKLDSILEGRKLDVCEDSGLREYFPDFLYHDLTVQAWNALEDDGIMTTGNMNKNRTQAKFLHGLMGWPIPVQMRKIDDIIRLHAEAGIPKKASRLRVTQDGVYTLSFSSKAKA